MSQYIRTCLCRIASIIISNLLTIFIIETAPSISIVLVFLIKEIVNG